MNTELWRVDVAGVSHRFVEAESKQGAIEAVRESIVEAIDIRAEKADPVLRRLYAGLTSHRRRNIVAALDGLATPAAVRHARSARRRLAREVRFDMSIRDWVERASSSFRRPVDPEGLSVLLRHFEMNRLQELRFRLSEAERELYGDEVGPSSRLRRST